MTDLSALTALGNIDVEPNGLTAWFTNTANNRVYELDLTTRIATWSATVVFDEFNGKFLCKPVFLNAAGPADVVSTDAELTTRGFGGEVIVLGPVTVTLSAGFTSGRTFRFNDTPQLIVPAGPAVALTGVLRGSGFHLTGGGALITTGSYTLGPSTWTTRRCR